MGLIVVKIIVSRISGRGWAWGEGLLGESPFEIVAIV